MTLGRVVLLSVLGMLLSVGGVLALTSPAPPPRPTDTHADAGYPPPSYELDDAGPAEPSPPPHEPGDAGPAPNPNDIVDRA